LLWKWMEWRGKPEKPLPTPANGIGSNCHENTNKSSAKSAAKRAVSTFAGMVPETPEVEAFIRWMRRNNCTGEWQQDELYEVYSEVCQLAEFSAMGPIIFGRELGRAGCRKWDADLRKGGKGSRLKMVSIPVAGDLAVKPPNLAGENRLPKPPKSIGKLGNSPLGRKPVRRVAYQ
jgi:hypothetical protein